jgi:hypothetical protein
MDSYFVGIPCPGFSVSLFWRSEIRTRSRVADINKMTRRAVAKISSDEVFGNDPPIGIRFANLDFLLKSSPESTTKHPTRINQKFILKKNEIRR